MKSDEIRIDQTGVTVLGFAVGRAPKARDLEFALEGQVLRSLTPLNRRQLRLCDAKGLSWLIDMERELVLWFDVLLSKFRHGPQDDRDPADVFRGKICIGPYTVMGAFSFETGEIVRKVAIPSLSLNLIPGEKRIRALTVAFVENEKQSDAAMLSKRAGA